MRGETSKLLLINIKVPWVWILAVAIIKSYGGEDKDDGLEKTKTVVLW